MLGRKARATNFPEIPADTAQTPLTRPVILFSVIRALAIGISVAIAFGLHLPNADWMPIATLVAMKTSLSQAALASEQRIAGALIGALVATVFLFTVHNIHVLEIVIVIAAAIAAAMRAANYAIYCAAVATTVLIAEDIPHPSNLHTEGRRVLLTRRASPRSPRGARRSGRRRRSRAGDHRRNGDCDHEASRRPTTSCESTTGRCAFLDPLRAPVPMTATASSAVAGA